MSNVEQPEPVGEGADDGRDEILTKEEARTGERSDDAPNPEELG